MKGIIWIVEGKINETTEFSRFFEKMAFQKKENAVEMLARKVSELNRLKPFIENFTDVFMWLWRSFPMSGKEKSSRRNISPERKSYIDKLSREERKSLEGLCGFKDGKADFLDLILDFWPLFTETKPERAEIEKYRKLLSLDIILDFGKLEYEMVEIPLFDSVGMS